MHLPHYLGLLDHSEKQITKAFEQVARHHHDEPDIEQMCQKLSAWSREHRGKLVPFLQRYFETSSSEPARLKQQLLAPPRHGALGLIRDLHDLWLLTQEVQLCWTVIHQATLALRDEELKATCEFCSSRTKRQTDWLLGRIKQAAPQTLVVAD
ncbi:molybdopterin oxidoreductase [Hymenobacter sp. 15J16-1T3B]|uniref:molybdopterin oxidoreductase n=1 Tax=Hymenobacter sp. 15J16-1T3B TaxID=2886941 RepID=UPI001D11612E|nr:molybdopterin oxidoreductase [Hymenobacter sp. 15J16-1T3B]MCC3160113.1 molybdopterin oxidoreductase [Hymenobacter sp. 15J16-1T3B]